MQVTASQAKNRFGAFRGHAKTEPVFVEKGRRIDTLVEAQPHAELESGGQTTTSAQRRRVFEQMHKVWIDEQHVRFEKNGLCASIKTVPATSRRPSTPSRVAFDLRLSGSSPSSPG